MKPAARLQGAIEILRAITLDGISPEKALLDWGRAHRFAGSSDRRAIHDTVYDVIRYYGKLSYYMNTKEPYCLVAGWLFFIKEQTKSDVIDLFDGERHSPPPLPEDVSDLLKYNKLPAPNFESQYNINASLEDLLTQSLGEQKHDVLLSLIPRAPLDIRVNLSHITQDKALYILEDNFNTTDFISRSEIPTLIRTYENLNVKQTELYQEGKIEIQDGSSQFICHLLVQKFQQQVESLQSKEQSTDDVTEVTEVNGRILDYCAGGGGKTLAIADLLPNKPEIVGSDISEIRLKSLKDRAIRAGSKNIRILASHRLSPDKGLFNMVLVDSPCSGSGAWRRNMYDKWTTTPEKIAEYNVMQADILAKACDFVADNGLLAYTTCSLFKSENDAIIEKFLADHPSFNVVPLIDAALGNATEFGLALNPAEHDVDGFYLSILSKKECNNT